MSLPHGASMFLHHPPTQRVLLQHRTDDAPSYPGHWGMFGGSGEPEDDGDPVRTLRREIHEELGLELEPEKIAALWDYMTGRGSHRYVFLYPWDDPDYPFTQTEGQGRGWFTPAEALESLTLTDNSRRDLTLLAERLAPPLPRQGCRPCGPRISCFARHRSRCRGEA
jgi:8-oxo-dGTP diphosphatase